MTIFTYSSGEGAELCTFTAERMGHMFALFIKPQNTMGGLV